MITFQVEIAIRIHARPATILVSNANKFASNIMLKKESKTANAKSLLNLLTLEALPGDVITVEVEGTDEQEAASAIKDLFANELSKE